jgi:hypothetical protein
MNIKINKLGNLEIERAGKFQSQGCPHKGGNCGDWCPLFGEPQELNDGEKKWEMLLVCGHVISTEYGEKIIDERPRN